MVQPEEGGIGVTELAKVLLVILLAALGGYVSVDMAASMAGRGVKGGGAWQSWPQADAREGGLYARYHHLRQGELPFSRFLGRRFEARTDDDGNALKGGCRYVVEGTLPPSRFWTLALYPLQDAGREAEPQASWVAAEDALPNRKGRLRIVIDSRMRPGTWLRAPVEEDERFMIVLRLYGLNPLVRDRADMALPLKIRRESC